LAEDACVVLRAHFTKAVARRARHDDASEAESPIS
jgi:hypothetical protein